MLLSKVFLPSFSTLIRLMVPSSMSRKSVIGTRKRKNILLSLGQGQLRETVEGKKKSPTTAKRD